MRLVVFTVLLYSMKVDVMALVRLEKVMLAMSNVEDVEVISARVFVLEDCEAGDMVGAWRLDLEKFFRVAKGAVLILVYIKSI